MVEQLLVGMEVSLQSDRWFGEPYHHWPRPFYDSCSEVGGASICR